MNKVTEAALAWVAGLFEGEGCITINRNNTVPRGIATLGMTDQDVVFRFHKLLGIGHIYHRQRGVTAKGTPRKAAWHWRTSAAHDVADFLRAILPWLGKRRAARAREVLAIWEANPLWKERTHCQRGHPFDESRVRIRAARKDRTVKEYNWRYCMVCHRDRQRRYREAVA